MEYGKWSCLGKLGDGGQGEVFLAAEKASLERWYKDIREGLEAHAIMDRPGTREERMERLFEAIKARLDGRFPEFRALKVLHQPVERGVEYEKAKERMRQEIKALSAVEHPCLAKIYDYDEDARWYVREYYEGGTLTQNTSVFKGDPFRAAQAFLALCQGVGKLHEKGLVHRDIKPDNVFVQTDQAFVLADFGLIYFADDRHTRVTDEFEKVGTTDWMPTWALGRFRMDEVKPSFDVFSLAKVFWAMIAGETFLRLHFYDRPEFDLRAKFTNDPRMELVNEMVLGKCLVDDEAACLNNARELASEVHRLIHRLEAEEARRCAVCKEGKYVGDMGATVGGSSCYQLHCTSCGHLLSFEADGDFKPPRWVRVLKDDHGRLQ
ncbi:MAG TPA: protein kinase [Phycisphaerae bacterium]|nr:protein kinase [Phycisphaerae bacterium]